MSDDDAPFDPLHGHDADEVAAQAGVGRWFSDVHEVTFDAHERVHVLSALATWGEVHARAGIDSVAKAAHGLMSDLERQTNLYDSRVDDPGQCDAHTTARLLGGDLMSLCSATRYYCEHHVPDEGLVSAWLADVEARLVEHATDDMDDETVQQFALLVTEGARPPCACDVDVDIDADVLGDAVAEALGVDREALTVVDGEGLTDEELTALLRGEE